MGVFGGRHSGFAAFMRCSNEERPVCGDPLFIRELRRDSNLGVPAKRRLERPDEVVGGERWVGTNKSKPCSGVCMRDISSVFRILLIGRAL